MLPDTVEYGEWQQGVRVESLAFGLMSFAQKVSFGLAAALLGWLLELAGYQANAAQSAATLDAIKAIMTLLPAGFLALAIATLRLYPLTGERHRAIVVDLAARSASAPLSGHEEDGKLLS
jgi:Na+/melibiose symporter-like transporter